jgi:hypothetical protein
MAAVAEKSTVMSHECCAKKFGTVFEVMNQTVAMIPKTKRRRAPLQATTGMIRRLDITSTL